MSDLSGQGCHVFHGYAAFRVFIADVDLQADLQRRQMVRSLLGKPFRNLEPVDGMHPLEGFGHRVRLVALQGADEVPLEVRPSDLADLVRAFLHVVFTKSLLPGPGSFQNAGCWPGLADGE